LSYAFSYGVLCYRIAVFEELLLPRMQALNVLGTDSHLYAQSDNIRAVFNYVKNLFNLLSRIIERQSLSFESMPADDKAREPIIWLYGNPFIC
jgi:hypothetical protein